MTIPENSPRSLFESERMELAAAEKIATGKGLAKR